MSKKRLTQREKGFVCGYVCACAISLEEHGYDTVVEDCLRGVYVSIPELRRHGVDEYDITRLMPVITEIERKRKLKNQTGDGQ